LVALAGTGVYHYFAHGHKHEKVQAEPKKDDEHQNSDGTLKCKRVALSIATHTRVHPFIFFTFCVQTRGPKRIRLTIG
jgi:hypothetical protein